MHSPSTYLKAGYLKSGLGLLLSLALLSACVQSEPAGGQLELNNVTASGEASLGLFDDWLTMSRVATPLPEEWTGLKVQDTATLRLVNQSADEALHVTRLTLDPDAPFTLESPSLPLHIAPSAFFDLNVTFTENEGERGVRRASLQVVSSGGASEVQLAGVFMERPEGNSEVNLQQIVDAFGYTTDIGLQGERLSETPDSPLAGDEVRSKLWERADPSEVVYVREIAAYHGCCDEENFIEITGPGGGRFFHAASYAQSVLPLIAEGSGPAQMSVRPTSAFEIVVGAADDNYTTNTEGNLGVRLWPAKDRAGELIPNTYIIAEDYVQSGCGQGFANCDYQDNVFLITNVQPAQ